MVTARGGCAGSLQLVHTPGSGLVSQIFTSNLGHVLCLSLESSYSGNLVPILGNKQRYFNAVCLRTLTREKSSNVCFSSPKSLLAIDSSQHLEEREIC